MSRLRIVKRASYVVYRMFFCYCCCCCCCHGVEIRPESLIDWGERPGKRWSHNLSGVHSAVLRQPTEDCGLYLVHGGSNSVFGDRSNRGDCYCSCRGPGRGGSKTPHDVIRVIGVLRRKSKQEAQPYMVILPYQRAYLYAHGFKCTRKFLNGLLRSVCDVC